ncbi:MAG: hypothetical protein LBR23_02705 [Spirochaetaceae bacterium]|jgi:hypothetical protein|nr:hypothetical protein [Spirochaetaceae bacterium]
MTTVSLSGTSDRPWIAKNLFSALLVFLAVAVSAQDLSIGSGDTMLEYGPGGFHLYIRKKPDIASVLITEVPQDSSKRSDIHAYQAADWNPVNGDEIRIIDGKRAADNTYSLIDSTTEAYAPLGQAFHIFIPDILYYDEGARHGEVVPADGAFLNIRAFALPYGDYRGDFSDSPFQLRTIQAGAPVPSGPDTPPPSAATKTPSTIRIKIPAPAESLRARPADAPAAQTPPTAEPVSARPAAQTPAPAEPVRALPAHAAQAEVPPAAEPTAQTTTPAEPVGALSSAMPAAQAEAPPTEIPAAAEVGEEASAESPMIAGAAPEKPVSAEAPAPFRATIVELEGGIIAFNDQLAVIAFSDKQSVGDRYTPIGRINMEHYFNNAVGVGVGFGKEPVLLNRLHASFIYQTATFWLRTGFVMELGDLSMGSSFIISDAEWSGIVPGVNLSLEKILGKFFLGFEAEGGSDFVNGNSWTFIGARMGLRLPFMAVTLGGSVSTLQHSSDIADSVSGQTGAYLLCLFSLKKIPLFFALGAGYEEMHWKFSDYNNTGYQIQGIYAAAEIGWNINSAITLILRGEPRVYTWLGETYTTIPEAAAPFYMTAALGAKITIP